MSAKLVSWFGKNGDPLLPENLGVTVNPFIRAFDNYQTYDVLVFSNLTKQLPYPNYVNYSENLANPFEYKTLFDTTGIIIERFTTWDHKWCEEYIDYLKQIFDYFLTLPIKWKFESIDFETSSLQGLAVNNPDFFKQKVITTWLERDNIDLVKRYKIISGTKLSLSFLKDVAPYSVVVSGDKEIAEIVNSELQRNNPELLYDNISEFLQFFKDNFNANTATNSNVDDPFRLRDFFVKQYTDFIVRGFEKKTTYSYPLNDPEKEIVPSSFITTENRRARVLAPFVGGKLAPLTFAQQQVATLAVKQEFFRELGNLGIDPNDNQVVGWFQGINTNFLKLYFISNEQSFYSAIQIGHPSLKPIAQADLAVVRYSSATIIEAELFLEARFDPETASVGDLYSIAEARMLFSEQENSFDSQFMGYRIKFSEIAKICENISPKGNRNFYGLNEWINEGDSSKLLYKWETESIAEIKTPRFKNKAYKITDVRQDKGIDDSVYNFASIQRANNNYWNNGNNSLPTNNPKITKYELGYIGASTSDTYIIPTSFQLQPTKWETIFDIDETNRTTKIVTITNCDETFDIELLDTITQNERSGTRRSHTWIFNSVTSLEITEWIDEIDEYYWSVNESNKLIFDMPDSLRVKEIHEALDASRYATYQRDDETFGRLDSLGFYIHTMARLLGINVMPDRSPYEPPEVEQITPDDQGNIEIPEPYLKDSWGEQFEVPGEDRVSNPDFDKYGVQKNAFAYEIKSKAFREDPNTGEDTQLEVGGYYLVHNIPQLVQVILKDLNQAISWEDLGASKGNIEKLIRTWYKKQFTNDYDPEEDNWEEFGDDEDDNRDDRLFPQDTQLQGLTDYLGAYLSILYAREGLQEYPAKIPESLLSTEDSNEPLNIQNYGKLYEWYLKQFDTLIGEFPIKIKIKDNELLKVEGGEQTLEFPNIAETLAELMGNAIVHEAYTKLNLNVGTTILGQTGSNATMAFKNNTLLSAIIEYLGFETQIVEKELQLGFNPIDTTSQGQRQGSNSFRDLLTPTMVTVLTEDNKDSASLEQQLKLILKGAMIIEAVHGEKTNTDDLQSSIKDVLLRNMNLSKTNNPTKEDSQTKEQDFSQWLDEVEKGFSTAPQNVTPNRPYGQDFNRRPKIRRIDDRSS